jgi:hypothetical protein
MCYLCRTLDLLDNVPQGSLHVDSRFALPRRCERRSEIECDGNVWTWSALTHVQRSDGASHIPKGPRARRWFNGLLEVRTRRDPVRCSGECGGAGWEMRNAILSRVVAMAGSHSASGDQRARTIFRPTLECQYCLFCDNPHNGSLHSQRTRTRHFAPSALTDSPQQPT